MVGMRGCVCRDELGTGWTSPCETLQLCPWQSPSHQETFGCSGKICLSWKEVSGAAGAGREAQGDWEGRRGAEQEEGKSRQHQDLFMSWCKDLPADMKTGRSFVVNHLKMVDFCPFFPILQFLDPTVPVLPCFRHITTAGTLPPCPALFSCFQIFLESHH